MGTSLTRKVPRRTGYVRRGIGEDLRCFSIELFLAPGKYEYKLLLNREKLTIDPDNPESVYDGYDGRNSVLRVSS